MSCADEAPWALWRLRLLRLLFFGFLGVTDSRRHALLLGAHQATCVRERAGKGGGRVVFVCVCYNPSGASPARTQRCPPGSSISRLSVRT